MMSAEVKMAADNLLLINKGDRRRSSGNRQSNNKPLSPSEPIKVITEKMRRNHQENRSSQDNSRAETTNNPGEEKTQSEKETETPENYSPGFESDKKVGETINPQEEKTGAIPVENKKNKWLWPALTIASIALIIKYNS